MTGIEVVEYGEDCEEGERHARRISLEENIPYISPYNDLDIMAGQVIIYTECSIITVTKDFVLYLINKQKMMITLIQLHKIIIWL